MCVYSTPHDVHDPQLGSHWATPLLQHIFEATTQNETRAVFLPGRSTRERHLRAKENGESPRCQMSNTSNHDHNNDNNNNNDINNNNNNNDNSSSKYDKNKNERIIVILMIIILRIKNSKLRKFALKNRPTQLGDSGCSPTFSTWHGTWFACGGSSQRKHHSCLTRVELHHPHVFLQNMSKHLSLVNCHSISTPWVVMWFTHIYIYIFYIYIYIYTYIYNITGLLPA